MKMPMNLEESPRIPTPQNNINTTPSLPPTWSTSHPLQLQLPTENYGRDKVRAFARLVSYGVRFGVEVRLVDGDMAQHLPQAH